MLPGALAPVPLLRLAAEAVERLATQRRVLSRVLTEGPSGAAVGPDTRVLAGLVEQRREQAVEALTLAGVALEGDGRELAPRVRAMTRMLTERRESLAYDDQAANGLCNLADEIEARNTEPTSPNERIAG